MVNLLTFRLNDSLFAIPIEIVKWIVSVEKVYPISMMADYIIGEIRYGEHINFLVCFEKILNAGECKESIIDKNAIIISIKEKEFAIVVDEILYIKEIENYEYAHDKVSFLSEGQEVVEVFKPEFFDKLIDVPAIQPDYEKEKKRLLSAHNIIEEEVRDLLLFSLNNTLFAIESQLVQFVEVLEDTTKSAFKPQDKNSIGIFLAKRRLLKLLDLKKIFHLDNQKIGNNILVLKNQERYLGLSVDEIYNIESIDPNSIYKSEDKGIVQEYFLYNDTIVSILHSDTLRQLTLTEGIENTKEHPQSKTTKSIVDMQEFLIILIGSSKYAIPMENVKEIHEEKDVHVTRSLERSKRVEGIATIGAKSFLVIDLLGLLGETKQKDSLLLVLEEHMEGKTFEFAIFINEVEDIIHVAKEEIYKLTKEDKFIQGTIAQDNELYNIINIQWLIKYLKEDR